MNKMLPSRNRGKHRGKEKQDARRKENDRNKDVLSDMCTSHPGKTLDRYCLQCDKVYCRDCIETGLHNIGDGLHELKYVIDVAFDFEDSEEFKEYDKELLKLRKKLQRSFDKTKEYIKLSNELHEVAEKRNKNQKETLINLIETHYQDILEKNKKRNHDCLTKLDDITQESNGLEAQFKQIEKEINGKKDKMVPLFIAIKKSNETIQRIEGNIRSLNERNIVSRYVFKAGEQARTFMKKISDFGKLEDQNLNSLGRSSAIPTENTQGSGNNRNHFQGSHRNIFQITCSRPEGLFSEHSEENLDSFEVSSSYDTDESTGTFDDDHNSSNLRPSTREVFQRRSGSMLSLPSSSRSLGDFTEFSDRRTFRYDKPLSRTHSVAWIPNSDGLSGLQEEGDYLEPLNKDTAFAGMDQGQFSNSKESLNSLNTSRRARLNTSSGARPKIPPRPDPKPSAQVIKRARERSNSLYGFDHHDFDRQTQSMPEKFKVLNPYTPDNGEDLSFSEGDIVTVLQKCSNGLYAVELNGQHGYIPTNCLEGTVLHESIRSKLESMYRSPE